MFVFGREKKSGRDRSVSDDDSSYRAKRLFEQLLNYYVMSRTPARLERYLEDELGACRNTDLEQRLAELDALEALLDDETVATDIRTLSALGDETRYRLVRLLVEADDELCVCEITPLVDVSDSAVSHALSNLADAGLVRKRKDGRWRKYRATPRANALLTVLDGSR